MHRAPSHAVIQDGLPNLGGHIILFIKQEQGCKHFLVHRHTRGSRDLESLDEATRFVYVKWGGWWDSISIGCFRPMTLTLGYTKLPNIACYVIKWRKKLIAAAVRPDVQADRARGLALFPCHLAAPFRLHHNNWHHTSHPQMPLPFAVSPVRLWACLRSPEARLQVSSWEGRKWKGLMFLGMERAMS